MAKDSFEEFLKIREKAASAYVRGDGSEVDGIVPHDGKASFHSPTGDTVKGAKTVAKRYLKDCEAFHSNGKSRFEVIHQEHSGDLGFWTAFQIATVQIGDMPKPIDMRIRITEVFKKIGGEWKMIHRHADLPSPK